MTDARLGRLVEFDERSREFPIMAVIAPTLKPRSYTWSIDKTLDQGQTGSCVGNAWAHELIAKPVPNECPDETYAVEKIYWAAQKIDAYPGGDYPGAHPKSGGTSVLCGAKIVQQLGHIGEYRWAFGIDDLILALGHAGPAVLGISWFNDMFNPDADGRLHPTGGVAGGHAILAHKVQIPNGTTRPDGRIWLHNSWGAGWGLNGDAYLTFADMATLLAAQGEACIPGLRVMVACA